MSVHCAIIQRIKLCHEAADYHAGDRRSTRTNSTPPVDERASTPLSIEDQSTVSAVVTSAGGCTGIKGRSSGIKAFASFRTADVPVRSKYRRRKNGERASSSTGYDTLDVVRMREYFVSH